jgi:hypothetical protein
VSTSSPLPPDIAQLRRYQLRYAHAAASAATPPAAAATCCTVLLLLLLAQALIAMVIKHKNLISTGKNGAIV